MNGNDSEILRCVYHTLSLVEAHYDRPISVKELEAVSNYSYRNIQRIFKYSCGETIGAYQKRLRVENAYKMMLYTKESITSIALHVGFANLASFSKAFKQRFGCAPQQAKEEKDLLFGRASIVPMVSEAPIQPEIIYQPPLQVYYESIFTAYDNNEKIESLWDRFLQHTFPAPGTGYLGIIADEPLIRAALDCRYDACATAQAERRELPSKTIMGGRYAQFVHTGVYDTIEETYKKIYSGWILRSGLAFASSPIIEKYLEHAGNTDATQQTSILLPLL